MRPRLINFPNLAIGFLLALAIATLITVLTGCGTDADQQSTCRDAARHVFTQVMAEPAEMTVKEGNAYLDDHCAGVSASDRKAIVDGERDAAIAQYTSR